MGRWASVLALRFSFHLRTMSTNSCCTLTKAPFGKHGIYSPLISRLFSKTTSITTTSQLARNERRRRRTIQVRAKFSMRYVLGSWEVELDKWKFPKQLALLLCIHVHRWASCALCCCEKDGRSILLFLPNSLHGYCQIKLCFVNDISLTRSSRFLPHKIKSSYVILT